MKPFIMILLVTFIIPLFGCQTIHKNDKEAKKQEEILSSQKSLIVNYLNKGVPNLALKELRRLIVHHPKDPDFLNLMGLTQLSLEQANKAALYFKKSFKMRPRTSVALNLSSAYIESEKFGSAIKLLTRVKDSKISQGYQYPERIYHNIALAAERSENFQLAEKNYVIALSENPSYYLSLMRLGQLYEKQRRPLEAQRTFSKAKASCPKCFDPVNALAMGFIARGKHKSAFIALKQYTKRREVSNENRKKAEKMISMIRKIASTRKSKDKGRVATLNRNSKKRSAE